MKHIYIARQPIIDSDSKLCSYEVLYKGSTVLSNRYTSASIVNSVLNKFGTHALLGGRRAFIKIDEKFLMHDIIFSIPGDFFIFSILAEVEMSERVVERIQQLYKKGYMLSIDSVTLCEESMQKYAPILEELSFMKLNMHSGSRVELKSMIGTLKENGITTVAYNIGTSSDYENAKVLGCEWFQGYFFAEPKILENGKYEPSQMAVLKLYNLLMQDVNIDEITKEFENNHEITLQLLQFINSASFHFRSKISSIHHILTLVGRRPLGQWLMLMIYSKSVSKDEKSPLMLMVKNRTELMENILKVVQPDARSNMLGEAYFVGVLSLMDAVFGVKLADILEEISISDEVKSAILKDEGLFGEIFALVRSIEVFDETTIPLFEKKHSLVQGSIHDVIMQSIEDVNEFEVPAA